MPEKTAARHRGCFSPLCQVSDSPAGTPSPARERGRLRTRGATMLDAIGGVGASDLRALHALYLATLRPLAFVPPGRAAGALGIDRYSPSVGGADATVTYNRFGLLDGA